MQAQSNMSSRPSKPTGMPRTDALIAQLSQPCHGELAWQRMQRVEQALIKLAATLEQELAGRQEKRPAPAAPTPTADDLVRPGPGEFIACAAIRTPEGNVWTLDRPKGHTDIIQQISNFGYSKAAMNDQGFVTSLHRFVGRVEAMEIAEKSGQLVHKIVRSPGLYAEDLW